MVRFISLICAGLSSLFAGIAWLLQQPPLPFIALARWFHQRAVDLNSRSNRDAQ